MQRITFLHSNCDDEAIKKISEFIQWSDSYLKSNAINTELIEETIITSQYEEAIESVNTKYGSFQRISKGRGTLSFIKTIFNNDHKNPLSTIVIRDSFFLYGDPGAKYWEMIISIHFQNSIPLSLKAKSPYFAESTFPDIIAFLLSQWIPEVTTQDKCRALNCHSKSDYETIIKTYYNFQRAIKNIHLAYQSNKDLSTLWIKLVREVDIFVRFAIAMCMGDGLLYLNESITNILTGITEAVKLASVDVETLDNNVMILREPLLQLLNFCNVDITADDPIYVKIIDHPKYLFSDDLFDTEPRIVGFVDILGFAEIVEQYESDPQSDALERLNTTLNNAIKYAINSFKKDNELFAKTFEYKLFSDCLCVSLPYYDTETDFISQFCSIAQVLKFYQLLMLEEKFFVRGAISFGSYYSDDNMIFSKGLVNAYNLEHNHAGDPRIIIDPVIMNRIGSEMPDEFVENGISKLLIIENDRPDYAFLNPYNLIDGLKESMGSLFKHIDETLGINGDEEVDALSKFSTTLFDTSMNSLINLISVNYDKTDFLNDLLVEVESRIIEYGDKPSVQKKYIWFKKTILYNLNQNQDFRLYYSLKDQMA